MIRVLMFKHVQFGDILPILDSPVYLTLSIGDTITLLDWSHRGEWELVEVLTFNLNGGN